MGLHASNMVVRLKQSDRACEKNKHDLAKQLKKAGTSGQESTVFITTGRKMSSLNQSELFPSTKKLLSGRINEREDTALRYRTEKKGENRMKETKKKLLQETTAILKKLDKESLAIIRSNAEILRARDTLEEQKAG